MLLTDVEVNRRIYIYTKLIDVYIYIYIGNLDMLLSVRSDICNCRSSANEWSVTQSESTMIDRGLMSIEKRFGEGSQNVLIHPPLHRMFAFSSSSDKFSENIKSFLAFPILCSNRFTQNTTKLTFYSCYEIPPVTLTRKKHSML